jgi:hypothetical protein
MKASRVAAVAGLSVLAGSGWLLTDAYPSEMGFPFAGCVHFAVIGLAGLIRSRWKGWHWRRVAAIAVSGVAIFALPGVEGQLVAGAVSESANVAMFCAVPLMIVLGRLWFGDAAGRGLFGPALLGLCGALLVFSVGMPASLRTAAALAGVMGCCVAIAVASVWMFRLMRGAGVAAAVAVVGMAGAVVLGGYGIAVGWPRMSGAMLGVELLRCVSFDLPVVWLTVWLMREVPPVRLAARFLIAPVVTWIEGYAMVRCAVEVRSIAALVLMAAGAGMLLVKDEAEDGIGLGLGEP